MRAALRFLAAYLVLSALLALVWLLYSYPKHPTTASGWAWLFVLALPAQIGVELLGRLIWENQAGRYIEARTAAQSFSWLRIAYRLGVSLALIGAAIAAAHFFASA